MKADIDSLRDTIRRHNATLIAVSKTRTTDEVLDAYHTGIRDFGENRVQELVEKAGKLPDDIRWHLIGHLQKNKVKYIAPMVACIHSVDSMNLLQTIDKEGLKNRRIIPVLLQIKIASEDTKYGMSRQEAIDILNQYAAGTFPHVKIEGFMGMATFTEDMAQVRNEFRALKTFRDDMQAEFARHAIDFPELSMGMSSDFEVALEEGATMVRIGTLIFGPRS